MLRYTLIICECISLSQNDIIVKSCYIVLFNINKKHNLMLTWNFAYPSNQNYVVRKPSRVCDIIFYTTAMVQVDECQNVYYNLYKLATKSNSPHFDENKFKDFQG